MERTALLIASLQILLCQSTDPAPWLVVTPDYTYYITGEPITFICFLFNEFTVSGFSFYKNGVEFSSLRAYGQQSTKYTLPHLSVQDSGEYTCKYSRSSIYGGNSVSSESNPVLIRVLVSPPAPSLSLEPLEPSYLPGEDIRLRCAAPKSAMVVQYQFCYHRKNEIVQRIPRQHGDAWLTLRATRENEGDYTCQYMEGRSKRNVLSEKSGSVLISVRDLPPRPVLKVDPPSRRVQAGNHLLFTCSANQGKAKKRFHFYKDGVEMTSSNEWSLKPSSKPQAAFPDTAVIILQVKPTHTGNFSCSYEEKTGSRWAISPWSQKVKILVWAPNSSSSFLLRYLRFAYLLPILLVLLVFCCRRRKLSLKNYRFTWFPFLKEKKEEQGVMGCIGISSHHKA